MSDQDKWVTIASFGSVAEALLLKGRLESDGISAFIPDANIGAIHPGVTAGGQFRVQVRHRDVVVVKELLSPPE